MVNPDRPWPRGDALPGALHFPFPPNAGPELYRGRRIDQPLDTSADETLELWAAQPEWDTRSLEEFAADGGRPEGPPNRLVREGFNLADALEGIGQGIAGVGRGVLRVFRSVAELLVLLVRPRRDDRGRFYELPPGLELRPLAPAPPPPSTPMLPRAPVGGTGETGRIRPSIRVETGTLRDSSIRREDRRALRDELPPVYPDLDDSDDDEPETLTGGPR